MTEARKTVRLYEALELRAEYDGRIKTLRDCLPESRQNRGLFSRDSDSSRRPASGFSVSGARDQLRALEFKRRKLNAAIQRANSGEQARLRRRRRIAQERRALRRASQGMTTHGPARPLSDSAADH